VRRDRVPRRLLHAAPALLAIAARGEPDPSRGRRQAPKRAAAWPTPRRASCRRARWCSAAPLPVPPARCRRRTAGTGDRERARSVRSGSHRARSARWRRTGDGEVAAGDGASAAFSHPARTPTPPVDGLRRIPSWSEEPPLPRDDPGGARGVGQLRRDDAGSEVRLFEGCEVGWRVGNVKATREEGLPEGVALERRLRAGVLRARRANPGQRPRPRIVTVRV
jgi:hypothetical protein